MDGDKGESFWKRRSLAFAFFLGGMAGFLLAMSVSIESVRVKRNLTALNARIAQQRTRQEALEESVIALTRESRLRAYSRSNHLARALPGEVIYLP